MHHERTTVTRINRWLAEKTRGRLLVIRLAILAVMLALVSAIGRASGPPTSWATSRAETYGAFLCPAFWGPPAILLSPRTAAAPDDDPRRQLTVLHEAVHAEQAAEFRSCWRFNATMRLHRVEHLRSEAAAHCAEVGQELAWMDERFKDAPQWRDPDRTPGGPSYRERWWGRSVRRVTEDLLVRDGNYGRIAELGDEVVTREVGLACGPQPAFPAPDHPLLGNPSVAVRVGWLQS